MMVAAWRFVHWSLCDDGGTTQKILKWSPLGYYRKNKCLHFEVVYCGKRHSAQYTVHNQYNWDALPQVVKLTATAFIFDHKSAMELSYSTLANSLAAHCILLKTHNSRTRLFWCDLYTWHSSLRRDNLGTDPSFICIWREWYPCPSQKVLLDKSIFFLRCLFWHQWHW